MKYIKLEEVKDFTALLEEILLVLKSGGVVLMPSDTCYGFLVDEENDEAVDKLYALKQRDLDKPMSLCVADKEMLNKYVDLDDLGEEIRDIYMPGAITLVAESRLVEGDFLGVRIPDHNLMLSVAKALGNAFYTTSANISGQESPYALEQVYEQMKDEMLKIDLIIDAGVLDYNSPSTVIKIEDNRVEILREGELAEEIRGNYGLSS